MDEFPVYIKPEHIPATIVEIYCGPGYLIDTNERLLKYEYFRPSREERKDGAGTTVTYKKTYDYLYSKIDGQVDTVHVTVGEQIKYSA